MYLLQRAQIQANKNRFNVYGASAVGVHPSAAARIMERKGMANISQITLPSGDSYPLKAPTIPYGTVDSTSTATVYTATVSGITELTDGTVMMLHNGVVTSASGFTINVNDLGAKKVYNNLTNATQDTTIFNVAYTMLFVYSSALDSGNGGWWCYRGYDANTNTIGYQLRVNNSVRNVSDTARYYKIYFTSADNTKWVPASVNSTNNATTARPVNQRPIDPFGPIVYTSANTNYTAGSNLAAATAWQQYNFALGYSFNRTGAALTLTVEAPVYVKCAPQADGSAIMDSTTPYVQALPTTNDGKIYIYLGLATSATNIELVMTHPIYYHDGTGIRLWTGKTIPTKTSELTNDSGFITVGGDTVTIQQTLTSGTEIGSVTVNGTATTLYAPSGTTVDTALSSTSTNPVQNQVLKSALDGKVNASAVSGTQRTEISNLGARTRLRATDSDGDFQAYIDTSPDLITISVAEGNTSNRIYVSSDETTISNLRTPTNDGDAANKQYVDTQVATKSTVTVQQTLTSGTEIGGVTVNGTQTKLYVPSGSSDEAMTTAEVDTAVEDAFVNHAITANTGAYNSITNEEITQATYGEVVLVGSPSGGFPISSISSTPTVTFTRISDWIYSFIMPNEAISISVTLNTGGSND